MKALKGASKFWYESVREKKLYLLEDVVGLKSVGTARAGFLRNIGLHRIIDFVDLSPESMILLRQIKGVSARLIDGWIVECDSALPGEPPLDVDHSSSENPYKSKYGDQWEKVIKKCINFPLCVRYRFDSTHS